MGRERHPSTGGSRTDPKSVRGWTDDQRELLTARRKLAWAAQHAYYERSSILQALNYLIGVPVVLITALSASEIVASRAVDEPVPLWVGLITVSATVLASLQTFFRFGERAAFNAQAGQRYALLRRRLEDALVQPPENVDADLDDIRKEMEKLGEQSPPIGERRWLTWEDYSDKEQVPRNRHWWQILLGFPARRRRKRSADDGSTVTGAASLQDEAPVRRT